MLKRAALLLLLGFSIFLIWIFSADVPVYRAERLLFGILLPPIQTLLGFAPENNEIQSSLFIFEDPQHLQKLKTEFSLDEITADSANDFEASVKLMHWVRDSFPHGRPQRAPSPQAFDASSILQQNDSQLCGTAAQILIQALTAVGTPARKVQLRFTPKDEHVVVEAWSDHFQKWYILDPDYDIYYTRRQIPLNAMELHDTWAKNKIRTLTVHTRQSLHNIYQKHFSKLDPNPLRVIYETRNWKQWDDDLAKRNPDYHNNARFAVKLLNYYTHISYPLRTDWLSRPLSWWNPQGNHVQNSLVIRLPSMPDYEDFLVRSGSITTVYHPPKQIIKPKHVEVVSTIQQN